MHGGVGIMALLTTWDENKVPLRGSGSHWYQSTEMMRTSSVLLSEEYRHVISCSRGIYVIYFSCF